MNYIVCLTGGSEPLTATIIADHFELCGDQVLWVTPTAKRNRVGDVAGTTTIITDSSGDPRGYGRKVGFGGAIIPAEYLAFTLEHSRLPRGKIIHKDGNRENNNPSNLLEIG